MRYRKIPVDLNQFNRLSAWVYVEGMETATVFLGLEVDYDAMQSWYRANPEFSTLDYIYPRPYYRLTRMPAQGGRWTRIWVDFHDLPEAWRSNAEHLVIGYYNFYRKPADGSGHIDFYWDDLAFERVENPRKAAGWGADPAVVTVNQLGYKTVGTKLAILPASSAAERFYLRRSDDDAVVHEGGLRLVSSRMGDFLEGDFTDVIEPGRYYVQAGGVRSVDFPIAEQPYRDAGEAALNVLAGQRFGPATILHPEAHQDTAWDRDSGKHIDLIGGYYDAGDLRQFNHNAMFQPRVHLTLRRMLPDDDPMRAALLDESDWCARLMEKHWAAFGGFTRGIRMNSGRDGNYYTDNQIGTGDDYVLDKQPQPLEAWITPVLAELAMELRDRDPQRADRLLEISAALWERYRGESFRASIALHRATGEQKYLDKAREQADTLLRSQDASVLEHSDPPLGGILYVNPGHRANVDYMSERTYGDRLDQLVRVMEELPDEYYYDAFFALRRYADGFLKPVTREIGPWGVTPFVARGRPLDSRFGRASRAEYLGTAGGEPVFLHYQGQSDEAGRKIGYALLRVAAALGDAELEAVAQRCAGQIVGWNPFNFSFMYGFGQDSITHVYCSYPLTPGMCPWYRRLSHHLRTDAHEIWTVLQTYANASLASLDAPCIVRGRVTKGGEPYTGTIHIIGPSGNPVLQTQTDGDGRYGLVRLVGGGEYQLKARSTARHFTAVSGGRYGVDLDVDTEVRLSPLKVTGTIKRLERGPDGGRPYVVAEQAETHGFEAASMMRLKQGVPYEFALELAPLGEGHGTHTVEFHAANATVEPQRMVVDVAMEEPTRVTVSVTPQRSGELFNVLAQLDGDRSRRWDMMGVVDANPGQLFGTVLTAEGMAPEGYFVLERRADGGDGWDRVRTFAIEKDGSFRPIPLEKPGKYRLVRPGAAEALTGFESEPGQFHDIQLEEVR